MTAETEVCANCGGPVFLNQHNIMVCRSCRTTRQSSATAPSPEEIAKVCAELKIKGLAETRDK